MNPFQCKWRICLTRTPNIFFSGMERKKRVSEPKTVVKKKFRLIIMYSAGCGLRCLEHWIKFAMVNGEFALTKINILILYWIDVEIMTVFHWMIYSFGENVAQSIHILPFSHKIIIINRSYFYHQPSTINPSIHHKHYKNIDLSTKWIHWKNIYSIFHIVQLYNNYFSFWLRIKRW